MKKIAILISSLDTGGAERVVSIVINELKKNNTEVLLVLMDNTIKYDLPENQKIVCLDNNDIKQKALFKFFKLPYLALKYKKICSVNDIKTSLSFMNRPNYINILAKLFGFKAKIIISERIVPSSEYSTNSIKDKISLGLIKYLYPKADLILPNSIGIKYDLIKNFKIDENLINVVNNPVDVNKLTTLAKEKTDYRDEKFTFVTVGRLHPQKNHKLLIKVMQGLDAKLYIIGDGILKKELSSMVVNLGLQDKVIFLGVKKNPFKYLSKADCFVFSSNYEGFPNVILEALSCGLPVISTDCKSGPREILAPELTYNEPIKDVQKVSHGILVKVDHENSMETAMHMMMEDSRLIENYKLKSYNRVRRYDTSIVSKKYLKII